MASSSTTLRRNFCSIGCKALPSGSLYFRQPRYGTSRPAQERLNIYAAARVARHFLGCCIKPVTGLIVSRGMLLLWTHPFRPLRSGQKGFAYRRAHAALASYKLCCKKARRRLYTTRISPQSPVRMMTSAHIVVHYHELWLKRGNRRFFLHKLREALRRALDGIAITRISQPADRLIIEITDAAHVDEALQRLTRVSGISHLAVARVLRHPALDADPLDTIRDAAWEEVRGEQFATFAVRARRSDKYFPLNAMAVEREVGGYLVDKLQAAGRNVRVDLKAPELTCRIEITRGPLLVYARRILGPGGLPPNTAGK